MALPLTNNITLYRGDDYSMPVTIQVGGVAVNLTGCTITSQIKNTADDPTALLSFTVGSIVAASGQFTLSLTGTQTAGLSLSGSTGVYDVQVVSSGGITTTYLAGSVTLTKDVTR